MLYLLVMMPLESCMFSLRSSLLFKAPRIIRQFSHGSPVIRWAAFFPKEKQFLKYLKRRTVYDMYATDINKELLNKDFGVHAYDDFFGPNAKVDLTKLYLASYEDLNEIEKRQRLALKKELSSTIELLNLRLELGKAIHERNSVQLKILTGNYANASSFRAWIESWTSNINLYEYISQLPPAMLNEITCISDHEFAHYPFLAPFKFKSLCRITEGIREKLEDMPHNFLGILGSVPVALTEAEATSMGIIIDTDYIGKHSLYLVNISIVVTGHGVIAFVPKLVKSDIDIRYPIVKYVMHDGGIYVPSFKIEEDAQRSLQNLSNSAPTFESRKILYPDYTDLPLVNLQHTTSRITEMKMGDGVVHIIPEICLENSQRKAVELWENKKEMLFKEGSFTKAEAFYILHVLIASGAPEINIRNMVGRDLFVHDRTLGSTFIIDKQKIKSEALSSSMNNTKIDMAIFQPRVLEPQKHMEHTHERGISP